jgi:4a-hydroxytetrahydrobiopterin dehydratase
MGLAEERCTPPKAGDKPLSESEVRTLAQQAPEWALKDMAIEREYKFKDFRQAMVFVNRVAEIANDQDHHPDIFVSYNKVRLTLSTHKIGGLSRNDFIVAAKIDEMNAP